MKRLLLLLSLLSCPALAQVTTNPSVTGVIGVGNTTGTGAVVLQTSPTLTSPTLTTPSIGVASGTSLTLTGTLSAAATGAVVVTLNRTEGSPSLMGHIALTRNSSAKGYLGLDASDNPALIDASAVARVSATTTGATINGTLAAGGVLSTAAIGYTTGAGGTVTQATSKATAVILNTATGEITLNAAALAAGTIASFTFTNSTVLTTDMVVCSHHSGGTTGAYTVNCRATGAGAAAVDIRNNTGGSLSEALVIKFAIIRGATS